MLSMCVKGMQHRKGDARNTEVIEWMSDLLKAEEIKRRSFGDFRLLRAGGKVREVEEGKRNEERVRKNERNHTALYVTWNSRNIITLSCTLNLTLMYSSVL